MKEIPDSQSIFSFQGEIDTATHFKVGIKNIRTHEEAFEIFSYFTMGPDYGHLAHCTKRGYKVLLRPAEISPDKFLHQMMMKASSIGPIYCMKDICDWIFFGAK